MYGVDKTKKPVNVSALEEAVTVCGTVRKLSSIDDPDDPRLISLDKAGFNPRKKIISSFEN